MSGDNKTDEEEWINRSQGMLTQTEREVLLEGEQFEARGREARSRIRRRLGDALLDYIILDDHLPQKDFLQVFKPTGNSPDDVRNKVERNVVDGLKAQIRFVYQCAKAAELEPERLIEDAVDEAKGVRVEKILKKYESDPESLTFRELQTLVEAGEISHEDYHDLAESLLGIPVGGMVSSDEAADLFEESESDEE